MNLNDHAFVQALDSWLTSPPDHGPDSNDLIPEVQAEFDELEDVGTRSPREYLLDLCADDVVEAAALMIAGKRDDAMAAFSGAIDKARAKYVSHHLDDFAEQHREESRVDAAERRSDSERDR